MIPFMITITIFLTELDVILIPFLIPPFVVALQVLVNYARSSKEAEEVSKEVGDFLLFNLLLSCVVLLGDEHVVICIVL